MTQAEMREHLATIGYNVDGMHGDEIELLAFAEDYSYNEDTNRYEEAY